MPERVCKLCLETKPLQKSHFMPAALYPKHRKPSFATTSGTGAFDSKEKQIKAHLLCFDCEQRFDQNGESEVLYWVNPKGNFRPGDRLKVSLPRDYDPKDPDQSISRYSGDDIGVDMNKFAYFAISLLWRGAVHDWVMPDGVVRPHDALGGFVEPMRLYLLGQALLPPYTSVIVIAGSFKYFAGNKLRIRSFHGMEEVVGSIPTRSTIFSTTCRHRPSELGSIW